MTTRIPNVARRPTANRPLPRLLSGQTIVLLIVWVASGCRPPASDVISVHGQIPPAQVPLAYAADDWPGWRGPRGDNHAVGPPPPLEWSDSQNVLWKSAVPGRGHATPIVVGSRVVVFTADEAQQSLLLLAFDRESGTELWREPVQRGGLMQTHAKNSHASATPASDGQRIYTAFIAEDAVWVAAVDLDGRAQWKTEAGPFTSVHGYGSSPVLFESLVIVAGDSPRGGFVAALHRDTGELVWRQRRSTKPNFGTPLLIQQDDRWQLILSGNQEVISYDPRTGQTLWSAPGPAATTGNTPAHLEGLVVATGGYPQRAIMGIRADGSGQVLWQHDFKCYVPSPLVFGNRVLVLQDNGIARYYEAESGQELWTQRLSGDFSASPVRIGPYVLATNETGKTYVLQPTGESCQIVAENQLGTHTLASPVICGGRLYLRTGDRLVCIGQP